MKTTYPESANFTDGYTSNCFYSDMLPSHTRHSETPAGQLLSLEPEDNCTLRILHNLDNKHRGLQAILLAPGIQASESMTSQTKDRFTTESVLNLAANNSEVFMKSKAEITDDTTETTFDYKASKNAGRARALRNARARKKLEALREEKELKKWLDDVWSEPGDKALIVYPDQYDEITYSLMAA